MELSWIDIGIAIILLVSTAMAIFHGFVKEAISLVSWIAAVWLAVVFSGQIALFLPANLDNTTFSLGVKELEMSKLRVGIAFVSIIIGTLIVGALLNRFLSQIMQLSTIRGIDRILGAFFGAMRGAIIVVMVILAAAVTSFPRTDIWRASQLLPPFELAARKAIEFMPPEYKKYFTFGEAEIQASYSHFDFLGR